MASLQVQLIDENREVVHVDPINRALLVTSADGGGSGAGGSWAIDRGISFTGGYSDKVAKSAIQYLRIQPGANALHATITWSAEDIGNVAIFTDPTVSAESALGLVNRNGESATVSAATLTRPTTVPSTGTRIWLSMSPPGGEKSSQQFVLEPNSDYLLTFENLSGITRWLGLNVDFYEPELI